MKSSVSYLCDCKTNSLVLWLQSQETDSHQAQLILCLCYPNSDLSIYLSIYLQLGLVRKVFANGPETWVQSQVKSYQRLKKWYLMLPCLTLSIIRYGSRVKWSNPGKEAFGLPSTMVANFTYLYIINEGIFYITSSFFIASFVAY